MLYALLLAGCLVDHDIYSKRLDELRDDDGDGYAESDGDCDDSNPDVSPDAVEECDGIDNDCDQAIDDDDDNIDYTSHFIDDDQDGYGSQENISSCDFSVVAASNDTDCDDSSPDVSPSASEVCNDGIDNNCNDAPTECRRYDEVVATSGDRTISAPVDGIDRFAEWIEPAGDGNSDGVADILMTAPGGDSPALFLYSGLDIPNEIDSEPLGSIIASDSIPRFASSVEYVPATTLFGDPAIAVSSSDSLYLFDYPVLEQADESHAFRSIGLGWEFELTTVEFGPSATVDVNRNGISELIVSRIGTDGASAVHLLSEPDWTGSVVDLDDVTQIQINSDSLYTPEYVANSGDLQGDGFDDICVASPLAETSAGATGSVMLFSPEQVGRDSELVDEATVISGEVAGGAFGAGRCAAAGDVDGDGYPDLRIGAPFEGPESAPLGAAYYFFGPIEDHSAASDAAVKISGDVAGDMFGLLAGVPGDLDGDGLLDLVVSAPAAADGTGTATVFYGPLQVGSHQMADADFTIRGTMSIGGIQTAAIVGDLNGDSRAELLISAPRANDNAGAAYLFLGSGI